jgi:hypothetical protein
MQKVFINMRGLFVSSAVFVLSFNSLHGMQLPPPESSSWRIIHVIPVVNQPEESYDTRGNLSISDNWYVLLGENIKRGGGKIPNNTEWDVLTASQSDVQPRTIFGIATIKSVPWQRTKQFFMKTVYNTLELLTGKVQVIFTARKGLYTRDDYAYYYQGEPIPYYFIKDTELYVFLKLSNKKNSKFLADELQWASTWKQQFIWAPISRLKTIAERGVTFLNQSDNDYRVSDNIKALFGHKQTPAPAPAASSTEWEVALAHFTEYEKGLSAETRNRRIAVQKHDIEQELSYYAQEDSWLLFSRGLYFNEDTKDYNAFTLNDANYPLEFSNNQEYSTLQEYREEIVANMPQRFGALRNQSHLDAVYQGLEEKLKAHFALQTLLLNTGNAVLVYANKKDSFFGIGPAGHGENYLGRILMVLRTNLRVPVGEAKMIFTPATAYPLDKLMKEFGQVNQVRGMIRYLRYRTTGGLPAMVRDRFGEKKEDAKNKIEALYNEPDAVGEPETTQVPAQAKQQKRILVKQSQQSFSAKPSVTQDQQPSAIIKTSAGAAVTGSTITRREVTLTEEEQAEQRKRKMVERMAKAVTGPKPEPEEGTGVGGEKEDKGG